MVAPSDPPLKDGRRQDFYARIERAEVDQAPLAVDILEVRNDGVAAFAAGYAPEVPTHRPAQPQVARKEQAV